MTSSNYDSAQN